MLGGRLEGRCSKMKLDKAEAGQRRGGTHLWLLAVTTFADLLRDEPGAPLLVIQVMLLLPRLLLLSADCLGVSVDVLDVPAFRRLIHLTKTWK